MKKSNKILGGVLLSLTTIVSLVFAVLLVYPYNSVDYYRFYSTLREPADLQALYQGKTIKSPTEYKLVIGTTLEQPTSYFSDEFFNSNSLVISLCRGSSFIPSKVYKASSDGASEAKVTYVREVDDLNVGIKLDENMYVIDLIPIKKTAVDKVNLKTIVKDA